MFVRRSDRSTVRVVWTLCLLAVGLSTAYFWRYHRAQSAVDATLSAEAKAASLGNQVPDSASNGSSRTVGRDDNPPAGLVRPTPRDVLRAEREPTSQEPDVLRLARESFLNGNVVDARKRLMSALTPAAESGLVGAIRDEMIKLAEATVFSRALFPGDPLVGTYRIQPGDTFDGIAKRHRIPSELLATINPGVPGRKLTVGRSIKVVHGPFSVRVSKSDYRLDVLVDGVLVRSMRCGLGANGSTPTGEWIIRDKLANPGWTDPRSSQHYHPDDPDNPIGEYWLALEGVSGDAIGRKGFGIHGTVEPESIGQQRSLGCVRLAPEDIEQLFNLLVIGASRVEIVD